MRKLQQELGMGMIFVTHDLGVAAEIADRVAVMYAGRIVETGTVQEVLTDPKHPYTKGMLSSTVHGNMRGQDIEAIPGSPPDLRALPTGCSFGPALRLRGQSLPGTAPPRSCSAMTVWPVASKSMRHRPSPTPVPSRPNGAILKRYRDA